jgi:inorganic pyrophosphatase
VRLTWLPIVLLPVAAAAQIAQHAPATLPAVAAEKLTASLEAAQPHRRSVWRDTPPINADGTINGYIEIAKGDRRKWEFRIDKNARAIDRMMPESLGGYPINYGFVPQTVSYDGDPFDILVLGPPIEGGSVVRGVPVGVMFMEDEKGLDSKVVVTRVDDTGRPLHQLTESIQNDVGSFFNRYKEHEKEIGAFSKVPGWGTGEAGIALVRLTHQFFLKCRARTSACAVAPAKQGFLAARVVF